MKQLANVLYILTEGSYLHCENGTVCVKVGGKDKVRIPAHTIESIICLCNTTVSTPFIGFCGERGIALSFHSDTGRFYGRIYGPVNGNVLLRSEQYRWIGTPQATEVVRHIVQAKLYNSRNVLLKAARGTEEASAAQLRGAAETIAAQGAQLTGAETIDSIRGIEGAAATAYFRVFDAMCKVDDPEMRFEKRTRRPPENRVNALLSFVYMLLKNEMQSALESVGIDPAAGYLHTLRPGRPSMALDLMEELRAPLCDRFVIALLNRGQIKCAGFEHTGNEFRLSDQARRLVISEWQQRKKETITHPFLKEKIPIGLIPYCQAMLLARHLRGDIAQYPPYLWR